MAVSTIAQYTGGGIKIPCILKEGNLTYGAKMHGPDGMSDAGVSIQYSIEKGDWVELSADAGNTYDATKGNPVVIPLATAGTVVMGQVVSEPTWVTVPGSSQTTWATMLAGGYYRVATVEFFGLSGVAKAVFKSTNTGAVTAGSVALLKVDVSETAALAGTTAPIKLAVSDVASGGMLLAFFYHAQAIGATTSTMVGFPTATVTQA